jgi:DNA-binding GntR family transcriptional regulator
MRDDSAGRPAKERDVTAHIVNTGDLTVARPTVTLRDQVVTKLRDAITDGHFPPGTRLVERQMCELLGVSRTLVREALRQLEAEGLVQILPYRGPIVARMSAAEVRELYEVRGALEGVAARRCAERASAAQLAHLNECVERMVAAQRRGDAYTHRQQVGEFYDQVREAAGNTVLQNQLTALGSRLAWLRAVSLSRPERASVAVQDEQRLLAALQARDGQLARRLCEETMSRTAEAVVAALAAQDAEAGKS